MSGIGYLYFTVVILLLSGALILLIDVRQYDKSGMTKEMKAARFMGWLNVVAGIAAMVGNWVYQKMMWAFF